MKDSKTYLIEIKYVSGEVDQIELTTDRLEWSMNQYQRNREPLTWRLVEQKWERVNTETRQSGMI